MGLDAAALDEALDGVAKELGRSALSKPVADALAEKKLADAEQAMRDLAKKVETAKKEVDRAKLGLEQHILALDFVGIVQAGAADDGSGKANRLQIRHWRNRARFTHLHSDVG